MNTGEIQSPLRVNQLFQINIYIYDKNLLKEKKNLQIESLTEDYLFFKTKSVLLRFVLN